MKKILLTLSIIILITSGCDNKETNNTVKVSKEKIEQTQIDNIKLEGSYNNRVFKIKLTNTSKKNYLITSVIMETYDEKNQKTINKFDVSQILESKKSTEMSFMKDINDVQKIKYKITKEEIK